MARSLTVQLEGAIIQTLPLEGQALTVGRLPGNGLTLPHPLVSRHHATLHLDGGQLVLVDAGSTNGTFVGDERLLPDQPHVLAPGETFRIGPFLMTYQAEDAEEFADGPEVSPATSEAAAEAPAESDAPPPTPEEPPGVPAVEPAPIAEPDGAVVGTPERAASGPAAPVMVEQAAEPPAAPVAEPRAPAPVEPPAERSAPVPALDGPAVTVAPGESNGAAPSKLATSVPAIPAEPVALVGRMPELAPLAWPGPARPTFVAPVARGPASEYLNDLPGIYQDGDFLGRFLLIFESIWEPLEQRQDHLALYFDPHTCPASFLPWLGSWLEFSVNRHWPEARLRRLLGEAMDLYRWRGTRYGLTRLLEICTGLTPLITEPPETPFVFHVSMRLPPDTTVSRALIEQLVQAHKPAHAGYVLDIRQ